MKPSQTTEPADLDAGTVDTVPAGDRDPAPAPARKRGRPAGSRNKPREDSAPATTGRPTKTASLARALESQYHLLGSLLFLFAPATGQALIANADTCAESLAAWAATNPKVAKALERTMTGAGAVSVLAAHAPIALAVYADVTARTGQSVTTGVGAPAGMADLFGAMMAGNPTEPPAA